MNTPDVTVVPNIAESASTSFGSVIPDLDKNWFKNAEVVAFIQNSVIPVVDWTRNQRSELEAEWDATRNMVLQKHDGHRRYNGRSNVYLPAYARARTTLVSQLSRGVFPSDEYLDVTAANEETTDEEASGVKALVQCEFEKNADLRSNFKPFLRQYIDHGVTVGKFWYVKEETKKGRYSLSRKALGAPQYEVGMTKEGCRFKTNSMYGWHIFPVTANSLAEAQLCFEDIIVPKSIFEAKRNAGIWPEADEAFGLPPPEMTANQQTLLTAQAAISHPLTDSAADVKALGVRVVSEVWGSMVLPKDAYAQGEDSDMPVPVKISLAGHHILEVRRNPFWHQRPPYVVARDEWEVGSFYPRGQGHRVKGLQHILNDFANQTNDNGIYSLNPMWLMNPSLLTGPATAIKPGGIWQGTDINAMAKPILPPIEQLQYGFQFLNLYQGMLMDHIGAPPIIQGVGAGKAGKTATQASILQKNAMNPLQDQVEDIENDALIPLMEMCYSLNQQYRDEESMLAIAGVDIKVPKEALAGRYAFRWLASSQAVNQSQRAAQVMQLMQVVMPILPLLAQSGKTADFVPLLRKLYSDGFGFRNFEEFIHDVQAPQGGPVPGMPMPGQPGAPPNGAPVPMPRSPLESANEAGPGETDDFMEVRDGADQQASLFGNEGGGY